MTTDMTVNPKKSLGLYIHVPFCKRKCLYCDFCSVADAKDELIDRYVSALVDCLSEKSAVAEGYEVDTIYLGGGTPTLLSTAQMERLLDVCFGKYSVLKDAEISCECNPATAGREYFSDIRRMGINRLSIGLQSMQDEELLSLGRIHNSKSFLDTYSDARRAGFENVSVDLMYGIPQQTLGSFEDTLTKTIELSPEHISAYCLNVEENTPFGRMGSSLILPDDDVASDMYELCYSLLSKSGYRRYEISNFSKESRESRHNLRYWLGKEYLGIGAAAHSYFEGERFAFSRDIAAFANGESRIVERETIDGREKMCEYVMLRMRLCGGVSVSEFFSTFDRHFVSEFPEIERFVGTGHIIFDGESLSFSEKGFFVSSYILSEILDFS